MNKSSADGFSSSSLPEIAKCDCDAGHCAVVALVQVRRHIEISAVGLLLLPNFLPIIGSLLHLAIDDPCVTSLHMTLDDTSELRQNPIQKFWFGKGKDKLN